MNARLGVIAAAIACAALAACGSGGESSTSTPTTTPTTATPTPTPTPTTATATPEQVASIIAGKMTNWREVIDGAGTCRIRWTVKQANDPAEAANATPGTRTPR